MKKKVLIQLRPVVFKVQFEEENLSELMLKRKALTELKNIIDPQCKRLHIDKMYLYDVDVLDESEIRPGLIVKTCHNEIGIITSLTNEQKPINVVLPGHRIWQFDATELRKSEASFKDARCIRLEFALKNNLWHEGDSGYISLRNVEGQIPVVIGSTTKGITLVHPVYEIDGIPKSLRIPTIQLADYITEFINGESREDYPSPDEEISVIRNEMATKGQSKQDMIEKINSKRLELLNRIKEKQKKFNIPLANQIQNTENYRLNNKEEEISNEYARKFTGAS